MYEMFKVNTKHSGVKYSVPKLVTLRPLITREMIKVVSYYRKLEAEVPRTHLIVKLIENLNVSTKRDEYSIAQAVSENSRHVCQMLGLVHPYNPKPQRFTGVFYNNSTTEMIVAQDFSKVPYHWLKSNWLTVNTIHIATHPFTDVDYGLCNGNYQSGKSGLAVFYIDLPSLMIQYKYWCKDRLANNKPNLKPGVFVAQIVIPNMLRNHMELCLLNRTIDLYHGKLAPRMRIQHPVQISDCTDLIDECCKRMVENWDTGEPLAPHDFYSANPGFLFNSLTDNLVIPDIPPTMNTRWVMEISVVKYIDFMVDLLHKKDKTKLSSVSGKFRRDILTIETGKETQQYLGIGGRDYFRNIKSKLQESF